VPSAFSPNGDGKNDRIYVRGYGIKTIKWEIYNRWGILMFSTNDLAEGWDGKYKGEIQPQDVYHYTLIVDFYDDKKETKTGYITLLRYKNNIK
jgi:gliding motility-associated-like protein